MATWVRQGTGTAPSATDAELTGNYGLDNATAPADFDPAGVTSVQTQWTITGSGFNDDSWDNGSCAVVDSTGITELSQHPSTGGTGLQNTSEGSDHTDSTGIPTGLTTAQWEGAFVRGDGTAVPNEWAKWNKVKGPDGSTLAVSALTVTITYTPLSSDNSAQVSWAELETPAPPLGGGFTFRGIESAITDAATATITINKPTGTVEDDLLIASIMLVSAGAATWQAPSGWTQLGTDRDAGGESQSVTFYKIAGASEPTSYDFTVSDNVNRKHGTIAAYSGVDTSDPIDAHTEEPDSASGGMDILVTSTVDGVLLYGSAFLELHQDVWTNADGMTTRYSEFDNDLDDFAAVGIFDQLATGAGNYTRTFNHEDTNNASGHLIALNPAPAGTTDRTSQVSWAELEAPDAPRRSLVSWAEMEVADAPREGQVSWAELEIPTAPREGQVSWAELEAPDAPREGQVSWAELEAPDAPRTGQVSWAELEVPTAPRTGQVSWAEMEVPTAPRRGLVSWAELETGDAPSNDKRGQVSWAELEVPTAPRSGQVSWAELEAPTSPRRALVSWAEMEIGTAPRSAQLSWAEMEMAEAPRVGQVSWAEAEVPTSPRGAQMSWTELEVPPGPRRATVSWAEMEVGTAPRTGQVSWAEFEVPPTDARGEISWAEFEVPSEPGGEDPHGGYQLLQRIR